MRRLYSAKRLLILRQSIIMWSQMSVNTDTQAETDVQQSSIWRVSGILSGAFVAVVLLTAIAYAVMMHVVDWIAVESLSYPTQAIAPFVVVATALVTLAIVVTTALITANMN